MREVTREEIIERVTYEKERLKKYDTDTLLKMDLTTSYSRGNSEEQMSIETAIEKAVDHVRKNAHEGIAARACIYLYGRNKDGWINVLTYSVGPIPSGKYNSLGYCIPEDTDEVKFQDWGF